MKKLGVIADSAGNIIGTFQAGKASKGAPTELRVRPQQGQQVYELDVADDLAAADAVHKLHSTHRIVRTAKGDAHLVDNDH